MNRRSSERYKVLEEPEVIERYNKLKILGRTILGKSQNLQAGNIGQDDALDARQFLIEGARLTNPRIMSSWWEHILIAEEFGWRMATAAQEVLPINPSEIRFLLTLHDIGRFVTPGAYLRNDLIGNSILSESGVPDRIIGDLPSNKDLMIASEKLGLSEEQIKFLEPLTPEQVKIAREYFDSLNSTQKIINLADNLGKRDPKGLFDLGTFLSYLRTQEGRYEQSSMWSSMGWAIPERREGAVLQAFVIGKTIEWLKEQGVSVNEIIRDLKDYSPRFVIIVRHGEVDNPREIVYNRDELMRESDIVHLCGEGVEQMKKIGRIIRKRGFNVRKIYTSPEARARESTDAMNKELNVNDVSIEVGIDDVYGPGPYLRGVKMPEFRMASANIYGSGWEEFGHEKERAIIERMQRSFQEAVLGLGPSETAVLVSHGDPIAWLANTLFSEEIPDPEKLRGLIYPGKGDALVAVIDPNGNLFTLYRIDDESRKKGSIY